MTGARSKIAEPAAKPSAGSRNAEAATAPAPCTVRVINRRRVTVSPSNAPGMFRSAVYLDCGCVLRGSATRAPNFIARRARAGPEEGPAAPPAALGGLVVRRRTLPQRLGARLPHGVGASR